MQRFRIPPSFALVALLSLAPCLVIADDGQSLEQRISTLEDQASKGNLISKLGSMFRLYGFLRVDAVYSDSKFNDTEVATRVLPEDGVNARDDDDTFSLYPRLTRLGFEFDGPELEIGDLTGKLEIDFYAFDTSDSRDVIRMRHAYLKISHGPLEVLFGQTSDLIAPLYPSVNADVINWNVGNLGDRRPQVRATVSPELGDRSRLIVAGAIAVQGAIDGKDAVTTDGVLNGEDAGVPQLQGRVAFRTKVGESSTAEVGVWGARGWEEVDGDGVGDFNMIVYGLDLQVPVIPGLFSIMGEIWQGENLSDVRGGAGQGINATTLKEIRSRGGWIQGTLMLDGLGDLFVGYTVDDPRRRDVATPLGITRNAAAYVGANVKRWNPLVLGVEWMGWETLYRGAADGDANRFRIFAMFKF
ncbi:MAG: hypothetical protein KDC38_14420 [Planctomycetes bacterium]|nr:hypothetical protein [Planctomycetota bacterium]